MTGFLPVWAQAMAAVVGLVGGLAFLFKILQKLTQVIEIIPVVKLIAEEFEIVTDPTDPRIKRNPQRVLPVLIEIANEFKANGGTSLHDRIEHIEHQLERLTNERT